MRNEATFPAEVALSKPTLVTASPYVLDNYDNPTLQVTVAVDICIGVDGTTSTVSKV
jgi:hypothetical protein